MIIFLESGEKYRVEIKKILEKYDEEFIPPLSGRISTAQTKNLGEYNQLPGGISKYLEECLGQPFIVAIEKKEMIGFLTFRHGYEHKYLKRFSPSNYITTVIVREEYRRSGIATRLYKELLHNLPIKYRLPFVTTRTWSTNIAHNNLLKKLGFQIINIITNDRGKGIDTLYFGMEV